VNITFCFLESQRNPYSDNEDIDKCSSIWVAQSWLFAGSREFTLVPTLGRIELDPSAYLFALAYSCRLFTNDLETIFAGDKQIITCLDTCVVHLLVFLACGQDNVLLETAMRESALNLFLQNFCLT
jgi:hypothetical protein